MELKLKSIEEIDSKIQELRKVKRKLQNRIDLFWEKSKKGIRVDSYTFQELYNYRDKASNHLFALKWVLGINSFLSLTNDPSEEGLKYIERLLKLPIE